MNDASSTPRPAHRVLTALLVTAVPLATFLALAAQPMLGKRLLSTDGGSYGIWIGCMVYFQLALLLGYAWAAWLGRKPLTFQAAASLALAIVALATFHLPSDRREAAAGMTSVLWHLSLSSLPAMILLFSTPPVLRGWLARCHEPVPGYLHVISNGAGIAGLLSYPFLIEPNLGFVEQRLYWHGCLVIVAGLLAAAVFILRRPESASRPAVEAELPEFVAPRTRFLWFVLSALGFIQILGATFHLTSEIGSMPLAWAVPLAIYLTSFMVTFSGRWRGWMTQATIVWLALSVAAYMLAKGFTPATVTGHTAWWLLSLTASASVLTNALLNSLRPKRQFERFYSVLAAGGAAGAFLYGAVTPHLFAQPMEFVLATAILLTVAMLSLNQRRSPQVVLITGAIIFIPIVGLGLSQRKLDAVGNGIVHHLRNWYGHLMIKTDEHSVVLSDDTTKATQFIADREARRQPTLYYSQSSGIGRVILRLQAARPAMRVGVIGLAGGTLATYARPDDTYDFWDLDPKALSVARNYFSYLQDSPGHVNVIHRDGRRALETSHESYDLIVVNAFVGDSIPAHLLTHEALTAYFSRLEPRHGLLVIHVSGYFRYFPTIDATARTLYHTALDVVTDIFASAPAADWDRASSEYVVVGTPAQVTEAASWFPLEEDQGRVKRAVTVVDVPRFDPQLIWSDDRNAEVDVLELGRFLLE